MKTKTLRRIVLFLGAGAAKPYGYPVTEDILPEVLKAIDPNILPEDREPWLKKVEEHNPTIREDVIEGLRLVLPGAAESPLKGSASIIDVLSTLDYLIASKQSLSPAFDEARLRLMRRQLDQCINGVLRGQEQPHILKGAVEWIIDQVKRDHRVSIITTNYDCTLDLPLFRAVEEQIGPVFEHVDFGTTVLSDSSVEYNRPSNAPLAMLKLHGSLNSLRCEVCGHLYVNPAERLLSHEFRLKKDKYNSCKCDGRLRSILVAPSLVRDVREPHLLAIWNAALNELRVAHDWNFIGYSLPQEDIAIRTMLLRALHARTLTTLDVRLALWDTEERRGRTPLEDREPTPTDLDDLLKERLARNTLKRYQDFLPAKHFTPGRSSYFPGGVEEFFAERGRQAE